MTSFSGGLMVLGLCAGEPNPALDNLIDDPDTPFDETSVGRYMPGYMKLHCNDDGTITIRHYSNPTCLGHETDYGASMQRLMNAAFDEDYGVSLADLQDDGTSISIVVSFCAQA